MIEFRTVTCPRGSLNQDATATSFAQLIDLELRVLIARRHACVAEHLAHKPRVPKLVRPVIKRTLILALSSDISTRR